MERLQDKRVWIAGTAVVAVLIVVVSWFMVISPKLSSASSQRDDAESAQTQNVALAAKVAKLKKENDNVGQLQASLRKELAGLPYDTGLPTYTRQLARQATAAKVKLGSISVGTPVAVTGTGSTTTTGTTTTGTGTTTTGTTGTGTTTTGSGATTPAVMSIPITLISNGTAAAQLAFLKAIQVTGPRRALVSSTTLAAGATKGSSSIDQAGSMTTQLTVFTAPLSAAAQAQLTKLLSSK